MVADLIPASSPGSWSTTSALKPARSHQRRYMRMSIWAQSWDSVPPAPGWIDTMAGLESCGPDSITFSSNSSSSRRRRLIPSPISASRLPSSPASCASSSRTPRSEACVVNWPTRSTVRARSVRSRISSCARRLSSQNAGAAISVSSLPRRCSLAGRSKMPPQLAHPTGQLSDVPLQLAEHGVLRPATPTEMAASASDVHAIQSPSRVNSVRPCRSGSRLVMTPRW
jgi:hypothetical protein